MDKQLQQTIDSAVDSKVDARLGEINRRLSGIENTLMEITNVIVGNDRLNELGMKREVDAMWKQYNKEKNHQSHERTMEMWDKYSKFSWMLDNFWKFVSLVGLSAVINTVMFILTLLKE